MRILMPNGEVIEVKKAIAVSEQRIAFNGRDVRLCEKASDMAFANAIVFSEESVHGMAPEEATLLGNLENGFVRGVLASLVQQGYADLSGLRLQKEQLPTSSYVFDHGKSQPYMLQGFEATMCCASALGYPFMGGNFSVASEAEDAEDTEEDDDE